MKLVGIATDSQSGIMPMEAVSMGVTVLPMPFYFGETCYFEGVSITRDEFFTRLKEGEKVTIHYHNGFLTRQLLSCSLTKVSSIVSQGTPKSESFI